MFPAGSRSTAPLRAHHESEGRQIRPLETTDLTSSYTNCRRADISDRDSVVG